MNDANQRAEIDQVDVSTSTTTQYGVRDWGGDIVTMPEWRTPADALDAVHRLGYTAYSRDDVLTRTTTVTVTETDWEAAR